jgi:hypothetical protein
MTGAELAKVAQVSMEKMKDYMDQPAEDRHVTMTAALQYSRYLFSCTLASIATPRTQVMRYLTIGQTFIKRAETGQWHIRYQGSQHSKTGSPLLLVIPRELSQAYDYYVSNIRPAIVKNAISLSDKPSKSNMDREKYVFPHTGNLGPR